MEVKEVNVTVPKKAVVINKYAGSGGGWVYCLGVVGAFIYYLQTTVGFWPGALGFLKALVWPAFLVYQLFKYLGL